MKEILEEYALIAQIVSAFAIIISLVFVGIQIMGNTKATRASTFHQIASLDIKILLSLGNSNESARLITAFRGNPDSLSEEEQKINDYANEIERVKTGLAQLEAAQEAQEVSS